jgi:hypothetical protein
MHCWYAGVVELPSFVATGLLLLPVFEAHSVLLYVWCCWLVSLQVHVSACLLVGKPDATD